MTTASTASGLDDVVVAETVLSSVDGAAGRLIIRGRDLEELAGRWSFEAALALLWGGLADEPMDEGAVRAALGKARLAAFDVARALLPAAQALSSVEAL